MKEPKKIPLTENPRHKEPKKIPLTTNYPEPFVDDLWDRNENNDGSIIFSKPNENNSENNSKSIQQLEPDSSN